MKTPIFNRSQFELCTLANPSGYPSSYTHAGIAYSQNGYNGYHYFLSQSPYPSGNDDYENPCFYYANARAGNLPPIDWIAYSGNPLQEDPGDGFNSDPDIVFFGGDLYIGNRPYLRNPRYQCFNAQKCAIVNSEFTFDEPVVLFDTNTPPSNFGFGPIDDYYVALASPAFAPMPNGKIRTYHLASNSYNDGSKCRGLIIMEGTNLVTAQNFSFLKYGSILGNNAEPWHIDVFDYKGKLYAILCCIVDGIRGNAYNFLAVSEDWENFRIYDKPLSDIMSYRSSACVREDGMFILYLATLDYKPAGNISADGRNILCGYMDFEELLKKIDE